jgi:two-component system chemotaxis sensor kinase CheA
MDPMEAIKVTFFQECEEQLAELESGLLAMESGVEDLEVVNAVFRAVHSIKGGAGAFGLDDLVRFAHVFESALDEVRAGRLAPDPDTVLKPMLRAADVLADLVRAARDGGDVDEDRVQQIAAELDPTGAQQSGGQEDELAGIDFGFAPTPLLDLDDGPAAEPTLAGAASNQWTVRFKPQPLLYANANEAGLVLRELQRLGPTQVALDAAALPPFEEMDPEGAYLAWVITLQTDLGEQDILDVFEFVDGDCELEVTAAAGENCGPGDVDDVISGGAAAPPAEEALDVMALIRRVQAQADAVAEPAAVGPAETAPAPPVEPAKPPLPAPAVCAAAPADAARDHGKGAGKDGGKDVGKADPQQSAAASATIRVDLDRVDRLIDLVGELVINQAMLSQRVMEAGIASASAIGMGLDDLEQLSREIQDSVMAIRAQPVKSVFQRMPRLAREVAAMTGKQVRLVTEGEGTEVDKTVIERLADPLTHMIRNAIDHGLETPAERLAAGKPAEGLVRLSAGHRSGRILIEISDDGAGINRRKVREIAVSKGLISADAPMSEDDVDNLIFLPGFSTATEVSDISGRGVGMDVVKRSILALGGRISISSRPGQGSTFSMSLPLTLAVLDGMVVSLGAQTMVVPLTAIVETLQPKAPDVHSLGGDARVIGIRGTFTPLIDVGYVLGYREEPIAAGDGVVLLIEADGGGRAALLVDAIQGQRQVVIKSLEANYRHVPGIAAATILGDGRVALILDIDALVAVSRTGDAAPEPKYMMAG